MKKIMFNDRYGLTEAVLSGRKTQTRRVVPWNAWLNLGFADNATVPYQEQLKSKALMLARYKVGEVVAIAQSYKDAGVNFIPEEDEEFGCYNFPAEQLAGWTNKMFVRADLMPRRIRITNVRIERLQDISDDDCLAEGIYKDECKTHFNGYAFDLTQSKNGEILSAKWYETPREAYAALIDKISGKGTWESNPYMFVYEFELVKKGGKA